MTLDCNPLQPVGKWLWLTAMILLYYQSYDRINKMRIAVSTYILNHLPDGTILAVTQFESSAMQLSPMTNITSDAVRNYLVSTLPTAAGGGTNIANGMELCRQVSSNKQNRCTIHNQCHKFITKQQSFNRTTLLDNNVFHKFTQKFYGYFLQVLEEVQTLLIRPSGDIKVFQQ